MNLIGRYFLLLLSVITLVSFVQVGENFLQNNDNYVHWGERNLKWSDFQGPVPDDSKFHALTHSAISLDFQSDGVILEFKIESVFDPSKSWKKEGVNSYILKHEQLHFDITEYHARLLRKEIKTTKYTSFNTIETQIRNMFNETYNEANQMQIDYDKETEHSMNKKKQKKWNKKIHKLLKKTNDYSNPKLKVNVSYLTE